MVKKSIIAIALMGMLATFSYGADGDYDGQVSGEIKVDGLWPATITIAYTPQKICTVPVYIKVGMFIQIEDCSKKIVMSQVNCPAGQSFPCYKGCRTLKVRANFEAQLSLKGVVTSSIIVNGNGGKDGKKWNYYFRTKGDTTGASNSNTWIISGDGNANEVDLCVETWDANIYNAGPNTEALVGEIAILAVPTAVPDYCDYCD